MANGTVVLLPEIGNRRWSSSEDEGKEMVFSTSDTPYLRCCEIYR